MKVTTIWESLRLPNQALLFDLEGLYQALQTVKDQRARRGIRYPLPAVLMIGLLAKDEDHSQLRMGQAPHLLAILNNTAVGLLARQQRSNLAEARRELAYQLDKALAALVA